MLRQIIHTCLLSAMALSLLAAPALASGSPSPENCSSVATIPVDCYTCKGRTLGTVRINAEYNSSQNSCVSHLRDIRTQCAKLNKDNDNLEFKWKYSIGIKDYSGHKRYCD